MSLFKEKAMKTAYTQTDIEEYALAKDLSVDASRKAHEATARYYELVEKCQADHPDLHSAHVDVMVLETEEGGGALYGNEPCSY